VTAEISAHKKSRLLAVWMYGLVVFWVLFDQGTKWWAETHLTLGVYVPVIGDLLGWRLIYNPGAAFGLASEFTWVLTIIAVIAVVGLSWFSTTVLHPVWLVGTSALLGGAVSHLGDRLFREPGFAIGHIVDFIDYSGYFVGNIADIALVGGAITLIVASLFAPHRPEEETDSEENGQAPAPVKVDAADELSELPWEKKEEK
jgi:signal peptidase II